MRRLTLIFFLLAGLQHSQAALYLVEAEFDNLFGTVPGYLTGGYYSDLAGVTPDTSTMKLVITLEKDGPATIVNQSFNLSHFVSYSLSQSSTGYSESATAADITGAGIDPSSTANPGNLSPSSFSITTDSSGKWVGGSVLRLNFYNNYSIFDHSTGGIYSSFTAPVDLADIEGIKPAYDLELIPFNGVQAISKWSGSRIPQWAQNSTTPLSSQLSFSVVAVPEPSSLLFIFAALPIIYRRERKA